MKGAPQGTQLGSGNAGTVVEFLWLLVLKHVLEVPPC